MSDLISRSELLKRFLVNKDGHRIPERDCDNFEVNISIKDVKTIIKEQPTAYDVEKVEENLKGLREIDMCDLGDCPDGFTLCNDCCSNRMLNKAIEIVKQGVVSDDVCEWRLCDEEANVYDTSCRNPHILIEGTPRENNYKYCPYCGKKIKVVEQNDN